MRRFITFLLILSFALPALAQDAPALSGEMQLLRRANLALQERYGLTPHLLGLFEMNMTRYGDAFLVQYHPRSRPHPSLTGEYMVLIEGDSLQTFWTHDNADPALWQSGELNSSVWGAPQLLAYLQAGSFDREFFDAPYAPDPALPPEDIEDFLSSGYQGIESRTGLLPEAEYRRPAALARAGLQTMYSLDDETTAQLHLIGVTLYMPTDGRIIWDCHFYHDGGPDEINYRICIDGSTGEILYVSTHTGGIG